MSLQQKNTRIQITKKTAQALKKIKINKSETYDEIINRVLRLNKELKSDNSELRERLSGQF